MSLAGEQFRKTITLQISPGCSVVNKLAFDVSMGWRHNRTGQVDAQVVQRYGTLPLFHRNFRSPQYLELRCGEYVSRDPIFVSRDSLLKDAIVFLVLPSSFSSSSSSSSSSSPSSSVLPVTVSCSISEETSVLEICIFTRWVVTLTLTLT